MSFLSDNRYKEKKAICPQRGTLFWFLLSTLFFFQSYAQTSEEYQIKAVFIYNFTHFINWPSDAFRESTSPFVIGIVGENVFGTALEETIEGEKIDNHPVVVKKIDNLKEVTECHILFIGKSSVTSFKDIVTQVKGKPILTVSDAPNFMEVAGIIRFFTDKNKIRLQINAKEASRSKLEVSSKLLNLATHYTE